MYFFDDLLISKECFCFVSPSCPSTRNNCKQIHSFATKPHSTKPWTLFALDAQHQCIGPPPRPPRTTKSRHERPGTCSGLSLSYDTCKTHLGLLFAQWRATAYKSPTRFFSSASLHDLSLEHACLVSRSLCHQPCRLAALMKVFGQTRIARYQLAQQPI